MLICKFLSTKENAIDPLHARTTLTLTNVFCFDVVVIVRICGCVLNVTRSDKRGTKSLGRSRDNWRKHHLGVVVTIYCFGYVHTVWRPFYPILTAHRPFRPIHDFKTHFEWQKPALTKAKCKSFQTRQWKWDQNRDDLWFFVFCHLKGPGLLLPKNDSFNLSLYRLLWKRSKMDAKQIYLKRNNFFCVCAISILFTVNAFCLQCL